MFHSPIFDIVVGLPFVYAVLSLICTALHEWIVALLRLRAKTLQESLGRMLHDPALAEEFYRHAAIRDLTDGARGHFSYLCPKTFARVLVDVVGGVECARQAAGSLAHSIQNLPPGRLRSTLVDLARHVDLDSPEALALLQHKIEDWFNGRMERTAAVYRRRAQAITCFVAFAVCVAVNADTLRVAQVLWSAPAVRAQIAAQAEAFARKDPAHPSSRIQIEGEVGSLLSWTDDLRDSGCKLDAPGGWLAFGWWVLPRRIAGWLLTTVAISLGAPFWFDTLNRFVRLRMTEPRPGDAAKPASC